MAEHSTAATSVVEGTALTRRFGHTTALDAEACPAADPAALVCEVVELPVQVNGKLRGRVTVPADASEDEVVAAALADAQVAAHVGGRPLRKRVVVPGRLVSLVV